MQPIAVAALAAAAAVCALLPRAVRRQGRRKPTCSKGSTFIHSVVLNQTQQHQLEMVLLPLCSTDAEAVLAADSELSSARVIGLDCEWLPERGKERHSPVSLLQLCAGSSRCYLAQLLHMDGVPSQLRYLLENPLVVKVSTQASPVPSAHTSLLLSHYSVCRLGHKFTHAVTSSAASAAASISEFKFKS
jgi:hypothetical protein